MSKSQQKDFFSNQTARTAVKLVLKGITIPSFKNNKMVIAKSPSGKPLDRPLLITKPEFQKVMEQIMASFESQLLSAFQTADGQTLAASSTRSLIALSVPDDDCWSRIPEIHVRAEYCQPGEEGAEILIERL